MSTIQGSWARPKIVNDGLVLYLDANAPNSYSQYFTPTTWKDLSGNSNNGTLTNGPTFNSGNGGSIVFDGVDDTYTLNSFRIGVVSSFTISCWFKRNILSSMNNKYLLRMGIGGSSGRIWFGVIDENNVYGRLYNNTFYSVGSSRDYWQLVSSTFTNTNWCELVLVQDKINLVQKSYFNGVEVASTNLSGNLDNQNSSFSSTEINASIGNLKIYSKALTAQEVLQNYNATKTRFGL